LPIIEQLVQLPLGAVPAAELLSLPDLFTSNSSVSRNALQLEHQLELLAPDMIMELSGGKPKLQATGRGGPRKRGI
jgi:hypothetical protein